MKPYGYVRKDAEGLFIYGEHQFQNTMGAELVPVYLHPKEWVGLTDDERNNLWREVVGWGDPSHDDEDLMKAIEAKLKEKNT